jgi:hypothetical protein
MDLWILPGTPRLVYRLTGSRAAVKGRECMGGQKHELKFPVRTASVNLSEWSIGNTLLDSYSGVLGSILVLDTGCPGRGFPCFSSGPPRKCCICRQHCKIAHKHYRKLRSIFRAWRTLGRWVNAWMRVYGLTYFRRSVYLNSCCEIKIQRESRIMFTSVGLQITLLLGHSFYHVLTVLTASKCALRHSRMKSRQFMKLTTSNVI